MNKWRLIAIIGYIFPFALSVFISLFTKLGNDIENCVFVFFVGILIQGIVGIYSLIRLRNKKDMKKERKLFMISLFPFIFVFLLFLLSGGYA